MSPTTPRLRRATFTTSRLLEFCSRKELELQTGHTADQWPLVIGKELIDNCLDSCEEAAVMPVIDIAVTAGKQPAITVTDNGPGIAPETVAAILDYTTRTSSREAYASPSRGAQGNALKTLVAMPFALAGGDDATIIEARGIRHTIRLSVDAVKQEPVISHDQEPCKRKTGTSVTVQWPVSASSELKSVRGHFLQIATGYAILNPHATFRVEWDGRHVYRALDPTWKKWGPSDPTSAHWYDPARFERLVAAYAGRHDGRTVREFVTEFRGLTGSGKVSEVLQASGLARVTLGELFDRTGKPDPRIGQLLYEMQHRSTPVKPADLGVIGRNSFAHKFAWLGGDPDTFDYKCVRRLDDRMPTVIEVAFSYVPEADERLLFTGVNWSPAITNPFRQLGSNGEGLERVLTGQFAESGDPVIVAVHLASPVVQYLDRGKSGIALRGGDVPHYDGPDEDADEYLDEVDATHDGWLADDLIEAVKAVTKRWRRQKLAEIRDASARARRREAMNRSRKVSLRDAAEEIMESAYLNASAKDTLPANATQIMYAARNHIQQRTGKQLDRQYFTQTLLPDYIAEHDPPWKDNVHYDSRGHFREPHTDHLFGLGTADVRDYLRRIGNPAFKTLLETSVKTCGPALRYGGLLFVEKEGFDALFEAARVAERHDLAFLSTKGISVTAARELAERICSKYRIPLYVLRDCDKAGFSGVATFQRSNRRHTYTQQFEVHDLGLRLADVIDLDIEDLSEDVFDRGSEEARAKNLRLNGATEEEVEFLLRRRVELNALTSDVLVDFVERKLEAHGVAKVVPKADDLAKAFRLFKEGERIQKLVDEELAKPNKVAVPKDLAKRVRAYLDEHPTESWDAAVRRLAVG